MVASFRRFIEPLGFEQSFSATLTEIARSVRQIVALTDATPHDIPIRLIRDYLDGVLFGVMAVAAFDRRRILAIIYFAFGQDFLKDEYHFYQSTLEYDRYVIPYGTPLLTYATVALKVPEFPRSDTHKANHTAWIPLRNWQY